MGDRGNIAILQNDGSHIYLYTHWQGTEVEEILKSALSRKLRWDDPAYLARIIFDEMTASQQGYETGFGISTSISDNEHPIPIVDCSLQTVTIEDKVIPFEKYILEAQPSVFELKEKNNAKE